jgi:hypothetical protein
LRGSPRWAVTLATSCCEHRRTKDSPTDIIEGSNPVDQTGLKSSAQTQSSLPCSRACFMARTAFHVQRNASSAAQVEPMTNITFTSSRAYTLATYAGDAGLRAHGVGLEILLSLPCSLHGSGSLPDPVDHRSGGPTGTKNLEHPVHLPSLVDCASIIRETPVERQLRPSASM